MQNVGTRLRRLGPVGNFAANLLAFLTTNWGVAMSAVIALAASAWDTTVAFASDSRVQTGVAVFLVSLWTYIGFRVLAEQRKPRVVRPHHELSHGLVFLGLQPNYTPKHPENLLLQFGIHLQNFSAGPIWYEITQFDVIIANRTLPRIERGKLKSYVPRGGSRYSSNLPFKRDDLKEFIGQKIVGTVAFSIIYGYLEKSAERQLRMLIEVVLFMEEETLGFGSSIKEEGDNPIQNQSG